MLGRWVSEVDNPNAASASQASSFAASDTLENLWRPAGGRGSRTCARMSEDVCNVPTAPRVFDAAKGRVLALSRAISGRCWISRAKQFERYLSMALMIWGD